MLTADPSPLFEWELYHDLEPSFRTCQQIQPDSVACSEVTSAASDATPSSTTSSESGPCAGAGTLLVFPNSRRKRPMTQDDLADKRYHMMADYLRKINEQYGTTAGSMQCSRTHQMQSRGLLRHSYNFTTSKQNLLRLN